MDADHGGRAADGGKPVWPEVTSPSAAGPRPSGGAGDPTGRIPGARPESTPGAAPAVDGGAAPQGPAPQGRAPEADDPHPAPAVQSPHPAPAEQSPHPAPTGHDPHPAPAEQSPHPAPAGHGQGGGIAALSLPYQVVAALALSGIGLLACLHLAMVFFHVAPSNTLTKRHGNAVDEWVYPEFEQNWKLFAPNPLQQNIAVHVRAEVLGPDGRRTTRWTSLSREDGEAIRGSLLPSHVHQNELRRAWDFYTGSHDEQNRANGLRGELSERYIRRIVMLRLSGRDNGGTVERIQIRSAVTAVGAPEWSDEKIDTQATYRVLPWWTVTPSDLPEGSGQDRAPGAAEVAK
ncbi:DUF5819 family protein [Streptomyces salyersiae]|uniref:DUF5819 family protein n=1 Tax=Streptomyces salyersiae TaxID=3075530 RepID=A0ABU2RFJ6_9ACTN|nr:DUF5819 family protein [Streptomyces sp. DSM 41770]MDT0427636.1 DUF5819 family protein [Streptomyces sp. DSM 41770]